MRKSTCDSDAVEGCKQLCIKRVRGPNDNLINREIPNHFKLRSPKLKPWPEKSLSPKAQAARKSTGSRRLLSDVTKGELDPITNDWIILGYIGKDLGDSLLVSSVETF